MPTSRFAPRRWPGLLWRLLDATRRVVLNLVFLLIVVVLIAWFIRSGAPALDQKTALVLDLRGAIAEQKTGNLRRSALDQVQGQGTEQVQLRDVLAVLETAAADPKISSAVLVLDDLQGAGLASLREVGRGDRPLQGRRQEGRRLGRQLRPAPVLPRGACRRGLPAPARHGAHRRPWRLPQLLPRCARQARHHGQPDRVGTYKSAAEPYIDNAPSAARSRPIVPLRRAVGRLHRRGRGARASCAPGSRCAASTSCRSASPRPTAIRRGWRFRRSWSTALKTRDELRAADDRARRAGRAQQKLPPGLVRRLPARTSRRRAVATRSAWSSREGDIVDGVGAARHDRRPARPPS